MLHQEVERPGEQGVSCEDRDGFAEDLVARRLATSQVIVVHGRQVVVDEAVGVHHLDGTRQREQLFAVASHGFARGEDQQGPNALTAREEAVAHGPVDGGGPLLLGGQGCCRAPRPPLGPAPP